MASLTAVSQGFSITVTDSRKPQNDNAWPFPDRAQRDRYHRDQAALAERDMQWFAVAVHLGRLLLVDPNNAELKQRREQALQKLNR